MNQQTANPSNRFEESAAGLKVIIDPTFDFRTGIKLGQDPDKYSKILQTYHKKLWSKELPNGKMFDLSESGSGTLLCHRSRLGEFSLSSDSISHSYIFTKRMQYFIGQLDEERIEEILRPLYTIGQFILFPSNKIENKATINGARGLSARIVDRFDLTLECIRRYYGDGESPLKDVLFRYREFFALFENFRGYVDFFLLNDLVDDEYESVNFYLPFDDSWPTQPLPKSLKEYELYISKTIDFVVKRGNRMVVSV